VIPMPRVSHETLKRRAAEIISEAGIEMDDDQLNDLVQTANGNWRDLTAGVQDMVIAHKRAA